MKIVTNKTARPIKIPLPGGKFLHLGPHKTGQLADHDAERPALKKLIKAGDIEILGEGDHPAGGPDRTGAPHESTHGHPQSTLIRPKGNR